MLRAGRLQSLLSAACFAITMAATPLTHQFHCSGVCAAPKFSPVREIAASGHAGAVAIEHACHGHAPKGGSAPHGCECIDDCCSLTALFTAPPVVADIAPPTLLALAAPAHRPGEAPRAPGVWLLPFATGPPPTA
jgi:hypothetical protein